MEDGESIGGMRTTGGQQMRWLRQVESALAIISSFSGFSSGSDRFFQWLKLGFFPVATSTTLHTTHKISI
jgi:hypothetical protein